MTAANVFEPMLTTKELAKRLQLSPGIIRRRFEKEPGVFVIAKDRRGTRRRHTLRIPQSVADRVIRELKVKSS